MPAPSLTGFPARPAPLRSAGGASQLSPGRKAWVCNKKKSPSAAGATLAAVPPHKTPNRNLPHRSRTSHPPLNPRHLRNIPNPANRQIRPLNPSPSDLPNSPRSPLPSQSLFRPSRECRHICTSRRPRRNHPPALPNPFVFNLTLDSSNEPSWHNQQQH